MSKIDELEADWDRWLEDHPKFVNASVVIVCVAAVAAITFIVGGIFV